MQKSFGIVQKTDQSRHHPAAFLHVAFEILDRLQRHRLADLRLQLPSHKLRHEHFVLKRADINARFITAETGEFALNFRDQ